MTWAMPFTSSPRLATSVATSICRQCTAAEQRTFHQAICHISSPVLMKEAMLAVREFFCLPVPLLHKARALQANRRDACMVQYLFAILSQKMQKLSTLISKALCKVAKTLLLTRTSPLVKSLRAPSRSHCDKPPCKASALSPSVRSNSATSSHRALRSTKMMVRGICCPLLSACRDSSSSTAATSSSF